MLSDSLYGYIFGENISDIPTNYQGCSGQTPIYPTSLMGIIHKVCATIKKRQTHAHIHGKQACLFALFKCWICMLDLPKYTQDF